MARKIVLKEGGLNGLGNSPDGFRYVGYDGTSASEKYGPTVSAIGESEYLETIINISSAQILNMGDSPVELLPAPGSNKYYQVEDIIVEYTYNTTPYGTARFIRFTGGYESGWLSCEIWESPQNGVLIHKPVGFIRAYSPQSQPSVVIISKSNNINDGIYILSGDEDGTEFSVMNPTNGDGTFRVKIKYKILTFGE